MARRVFLHVGTPKSGTTFLQSLWWKHRDALAAHGLLLPGSGLEDHFHAASLVCERAEIVDRLDEEQRQVWRRLVAQTAAAESDVLISHELFAPATPDRARQAVADLVAAAGEVHLLLTVRDLARQLPSAWQQNVKQGSTETLREFWERVERHEPGGFWTFHDVSRVLARWAAQLPPDRVHVVVVPPSGSPPALLWGRCCEVLGVDPDGWDLTTERSNESLGLAEVEVMRRLHAATPPQRRGLDVTRLAKGFVTRQILVPAGPGDRFVLPADLHQWAVERAAAMVEELRGSAYEMVGDLAELVPTVTPPAGRTPESVTEAEVAQCAVAALSRFVLHEVERRERQARRGRRDR